MNAQQLKNAILQEAIEGRLVPQDPNDEPASVLLARIRKEKERLVKEGKLKKKDLEVKPISEDEIPFEIPKSWEWCRLADYLDVRDGTHDSPKYHSEGIPFVTSKNLDNGKIDFSTCKYISEEDHKKFSERSCVEDGDILFAMIGSIGNPVIVKKDREFSIKNVALFKRYCVELTNIQYIYYYLQFIQNELKKISSGGVQSFVGLKTFREWIFPLPPLAEQHRIVAKIEDLLPKVEEYGKAQDALNKLNAELPERLKKSILQEAIEGRLVPQDPNDEPASVLLDKIRKEKGKLIKEKKIILSKPEKAIKVTGDGPFPLPSNWTWALVNDVCRAFGRIGFRGYTKNDLRDSKEGAAISLSPSNMVDGVLDFSSCTYISEEKYDESPEIQIKDGDILIVKTGSSYGKTAIVRNLPWKATINPQIAVIKEIKIDKEFLKYFFQSSYAQSCFKSFVLGTSIPTFSQLNLISMYIPLPPLAEQHRIVVKLEQLLGEMDKLK